MDSRYKWLVLSNTTLATLGNSVNQTIMLVALPSVFAGLAIDPLSPTGASYLLWVLSSYVVATTVFMATFGRIADTHGKVRIYTTGFVVFGLGSLLCALTPSSGSAGALELIMFRLIQGVGGAMLTATSFAILTDAFPADQRGVAFSFNQLAFIGGNVIGVVLGGLLAAAHWRFIFLISVPIGLGGAVWSRLQLRESGTRSAEPPDWPGNLIFGLAMLLLLLGLTFALIPYGGDSLGWRNPVVVVSLIVGLALCVAFVVVEARVPFPMFRLELLRIRAFLFANISMFLFSVSRGGLQLLLIIWLQAIWLPLHGVRLSDEPLQAGLDLLPMMFGFLLAALPSGWLADRYGARLLSTAGLLVIAVSLILLCTLPANFNLILFGTYVGINGVGLGLFSAPNSTQLMGSVPAKYRGIAAGMRQTINNAGQLLSVALMFTLVIDSFAGRLTETLRTGLMASGVPSSSASATSELPAGSALFASLLGYNPIQRLLSAETVHLPSNVIAHVTSNLYFASLIAEPLVLSLRIAFVSASIVAIAGAVLSALRGPRIKVAAPSPFAQPLAGQKRAVEEDLA